MAFYKPQSPITKGEDYIYPLTTYDQVIMSDGSRWNGKQLDDDAIVNNLTTVDEGYILDARQGYRLNMLIQQKASTASYSATLSASGWSAEAPYEQTVDISGILSTDNPFVDIDMSAAETSEDGASLKDAWNLVGRIVANDGSITAYCYEEVPTVDMSVILKVVR